MPSHVSYHMLLQKKQTHTMANIRTGWSLFRWQPSFLLAGLVVIACHWQTWARPGPVPIVLRVACRDSRGRGEVMDSLIRSSIEIMVGRTLHQNPSPSLSCVVFCCCSKGPFVLPPAFVHCRDVMVMALLHPQIYLSVRHPLLGRR